MHSQRCIVQQVRKTSFLDNSIRKRIGRKHTALMQKSRMFFHKDLQQVLSVKDKRSILANADSQSAAAKQIWIDPSMPAQPRFALLAFAQSRAHQGEERLTGG